MFVLGDGVCLLGKGVKLGNFVFEKFVNHAMTFEGVKTREGVRDDDYVVCLSASAGDVGDNLRETKQRGEIRVQQVGTKG